MIGHRLYNLHDELLRMQTALRAHLIQLFIKFRPLLKVQFTDYETFFLQSKNKNNFHKTGSSGAIFSWRKPIFWVKIS